MIKPAVNPEVINFLKYEKALIVEPSMPFAQSIIAFLKDFGVSSQNIFHARKFADAQEIIRTQKPKILITEYALDTQTGVALIPNILENYEEANKITILLTHDAGSSIIAEAAEEHVDSYYLKPISISDFSERFVKTVLSKIKATPFQVKIRSGKNNLKEKNYSLAVEDFTQAKTLQSNSPLIYYYLGLTHSLQSLGSEALKMFAEGLKINGLHYKCLLGKFDILYELKDYPAAYDVAKVIAKHFPLSPKRLGHILVASVFSHNLEDVPKYFEIYKHLEARPPELTKIFSAALSAAAKHYLKINNIAKADECFQMGVNVIGADATYIDMIIRELLKVRACQQAEAYLKLYPAHEIGQKHYSQGTFLIGLQSRSDRDEIIEIGKKLLTNNFADKECYLQFVKFLVDVNKKTLAEDVTTRAIKEHPELRKELYDMIENLSH